VHPDRFRGLCGPVQIRPPVPSGCRLAASGRDG
jgi:hypothetical protein